MSGIDVNSMTRTYTNFMKCYGPKKTSALSPSFRDHLAEKIESAPVSTEHMTMEEYKEYIYDKIARIPLHPSQSGWHWHIEITDSGFEAMQQDPEYEAHVLESIRTNFSFRDPYQSQNYSILHFGASEEESYGESFGGGSMFDTDDKDDYWERRAKRRKKLQEYYDELLENKAAAKRVAKEKYDAEAAAIRSGSSPLLHPKALGLYEAYMIVPSILDILSSNE